mgnify:CR=1 FL=1
MKKILLGNEAIVKGALDAGVDFVSGYPGCPSAEIGEEFGRIAKKHGIYAEWSANEKVALEAAIGASFSGLKSLVNMKSFGINVCSDSLFPLTYTGTKAPMVIFVGDDPQCHSSAQSEQDSRGYAYLAKIPILDPSSPQECYDFTKIGFEISEKFNLPVILRSTTRVAHQKEVVNFIDAIPKTVKAEFIKNPYQFTTMPPRVLEMKKELLVKLEKIRAYAEKSKANKITGNKSAKIGIITSGVSYFHTLEALKDLKLDLTVLKLGFFYPLPEKMVANFLKGKKKVLVVEELDPYLEKEIMRIAKESDFKVEIFGKKILSQTGELNTEKIILALSKITGKKYKKIEISKLKVQIPRRTARLCEGCPYWNILPVIKRVAPEGTIFGGDIGCNMIAGLPPHNMQDYLFSMGASMGISHGVSKALGKDSKQKIVSLIGDGTFFHSGIPGLINTVYNKSNFLIVVLDNRITAMTGHQQNPGMGKTLMGDNTVDIKIEDVARACGVKYVKTLDPRNMQELEEVIRDFMQKNEVAVIICKQICTLLERRLKKSDELRDFYSNPEVN